MVLRIYLQENWVEVKKLGYFKNVAKEVHATRHDDMTL